MPAFEWDLRVIPRIYLSNTHGWIRDCLHLVPY